MKRFLEITVQMKFVWGLFFSAAILMYTVIGMVMGMESISFIAVWEITGSTLVLVFLHYLIFGEFILQNLSTKFKVLLHFLLSYIVVIVSSVILNMMVITDPYHVSIFTVGYILFYLLAVFSFYVYFKATGEELNARLTEYKEKKNIY